MALGQVDSSITYINDWHNNPYNVQEKEIKPEIHGMPEFGMFETIHNFCQVEQTVPVQLAHGHYQLKYESVWSQSVGDEGSSGEHTQRTVDNSCDGFHGDHKSVGSGIIYI